MKYNVPLIFLDIDGVLNCQVFYEEQQFSGYKEAKKVLRKKVKHYEISRLDYYSSQICSKRIQWLNDVCLSTGAKIIVSSTWRQGKTIEQLQEIFDYCGATFEVIDKTERLGYERGIEISKWLKDNIDEETAGCNYEAFKKYVIIDDDNDMLLTQQHHFFKTDDYSGLTPNICYKIEKFFEAYK